MTTEITLSILPRDVLDGVREFFLSPGRMADAWIDSESDSHVAFCTFRGNLAVGATVDPEDPRRTRVRLTTLREEGLVPRLVTYLKSIESRVVVA